MRKIGNCFLAAVLVLFIVSASVTFTLAFRPLYYFDIHFLHIAEESGYPKEEIRANYDALIDYNLSPSVRELKFPTLAMSEPGRIHFAEVKVIFRFFIRLAIVSFLTGAVGIVWSSRRREYGYLKIAGFLIPFILVSAGGLIAANWERAFVLFHEVVFQNDYWIFDPATDPVITILPDTFFFHCAVMILAGIAVGWMLCILFWKRNAKHRRK